MAWIAVKQSVGDAPRDVECSVADQTCVGHHHSVSHHEDPRAKRAALYGTNQEKIAIAAAAPAVGAAITVPRLLKHRFHVSAAIRDHRGRTASRCREQRSQRQQLPQRRRAANPMVGVVMSRMDGNQVHRRVELK